MNYHFKRGDRLVLELINSDEILEGEFMDGCQDRITLINISSYKSNQTMKGPFSYYRSDISSVRMLYGSQDTQNITDHLNGTNEVQCNDNLILIDKLEYERLKALSHNYMYISTIDSRYYDAMEYIKNCETIGLVGITTSFEKTAHLSLIIISTWDQVYILDFLTLNIKKFPQELKELLECKYVKKVIHDSRLLTEVLAKHYNIKLANVFDTKVADIAVRKKKGENPEHTKTISECLVYYFHFPTTLIAHQDTKIDKWKKRPLSDIKKFTAAQMATFLITLKNHLDRILLEEFYKLVDDYSNSLQHCSMKEVAEKLYDNKLCNVLRSINLN